MSTHIPPVAREVIGASHVGGIFYDLAGHMLDQIVWLLGRPERVTAAFLRNDSGQVPNFSDNTLGVFEYEQAMAWVDIAAYGGAADGAAARSIRQRRKRYLGRTV